MGHGLQADGFQRPVDRRVVVPRRGELAPTHGADDLKDVPLERRPPGQQVVERRAEAVDVGPGPQALQLPFGLLGAHVGGGPQRAARQRLGRSAGGQRDERPLARGGAGVGQTRGLGQPPIDHQRLAVLADDHVGRLDVAVQDSAAVGVVDRVADVGEPPQQLAQPERVAAGAIVFHLVGVEAVGGLLEAVAPDEPHRVVRPPVGVRPQAVDRDDPGVLQAAGDLCLDQEAGAARRVVGVLIEDLLQRHLAVEFGVDRHEDGPQTAAGVGPKDPEPTAVGGCGDAFIARGAVGLVLSAGGPGGEAAERGFDVRAPHAG